MKLDDKFLINISYLLVGLEFTSLLVLKILMNGLRSRSVIPCALQAEYGLLTNRKAWVERIHSRPAVEVGLNVGHQQVNISSFPVVSGDSGK